MILVVTSIVGGAGRSTISRGLAAALARSGKKVSWIGADHGGGPDTEGVDHAMRSAASPDELALGGSLLYRFGVADDEDVAWVRDRMCGERDESWGTLLACAHAGRDIAVVDAPRIFKAAPLLERADALLLLLSLDRPAVRSLEPVLRELQRVRVINPALRLDGIVLTRVDAMRAGTARELEATLALAPPRAFLAPMIPDGPGPAREGAIESLALAWARRAERASLRLRRFAAQEVLRPLTFRPEAR
jgi:cellulose biosynthesis protein BcsQ